VNEAVARTPTRVNVGCGSSPTAGWVNLDNSPSIALSRVPGFVLGAFAKLGVLEPGRLAVVDAARRFEIRRASATDLPFQAGTVDVVYSSHMLEHLDRLEAHAFLLEAFRVLRPGGWVRITVPDLQRYVREYEQSGDADEFLDRLRLAASRASRRERLLLRATGFRGHRWMYDSASLTRLLESCGFTVALLDAGETLMPNVGDLDLREREGDTIYAEGRKP
jgi:SAM-dependent methyltransferase